jgi:hypothetical protein
MADEVSTEELYATDDVQVWAREFCRVVRENPELGFDEGFVIGWFSNLAVTVLTHAGKRARNDPSIRHACMDAAIQMHSAVNGPKEASSILGTAQQFLDWVVG